MRESVLGDKSIAFAVDVISLTKKLQKQGEYVLSKQLLKSGTSIGANIREAQFAHSRADFISKLQIALKEAHETDYWLELLYRSEYIEEEFFLSFAEKCKSLKAMLVSSINTARKKQDENYTFPFWDTEKFENTIKFLKDKRKSLLIN